MTVSVAAASACGKLIFSGGMPVASVAAPDEGTDVRALADGEGSSERTADPYPDGRLHDGIEHGSPT